MYLNYLFNAKNLKHSPRGFQLVGRQIIHLLQKKTQVALVSHYKLCLINKLALLLFRQFCASRPALQHNGIKIFLKEHFVIYGSGFQQYIFSFFLSIFFWQLKKLVYWDERSVELLESFCCKKSPNQEIGLGRFWE